MNILSNYFLAPAYRRVDPSLAVALVGNALALAYLAADSRLAAFGFALAALASGTGLWCVTRPIDRWYVRPVIALAMVTLVFAQIGLAENPRPWIMNSLVTMSLLPVLRRGWVVALGGVIFSAGLPPLIVALGQVATWSDPRALTASALLIVQTILLTRVAQRNGREMKERFDVEFLVRAMGTEGPIRLGLDAVKAESVLGQRLKHVQQRMAAAIRQAHQSAHGVQEASRELDASGAALRERTERSAEGLRDAAMTLEQITAVVQSGAQAALEARKMAASASLESEQGDALFEQVTQRMHDIDVAARRITDVIGVIDGIAFQTNILALNAAVEAARAGDEGRGFAAVAAEVRNLALRSSTAAAEIKTLIGASLDTVRSGNQLVDEAGSRMQTIVESVRQVVQVVENLSADTHQHAGSIEVVTKSVMELDAMTRQNVTVAESTCRIAHALLEQGAQLEQVLGSFNLGELPPRPIIAVPAIKAVNGPAIGRMAPTAASAARQLAAAAIVAAAQPRSAARPPAS